MPPISLKSDRPLAVYPWALFDSKPSTMSRLQLLAFCADAVLVLHAAFVLFVVIGLVLIIVGGLAGWRWVRNPWFRTAHLAAIGVVVVESLFGIECPLTTLEWYLRQLAGQTVQSEDFIAYWLRRAMFFTAPPWVFTLCYTSFGALVLATWVWIRPRLGETAV